MPGVTHIKFFHINFFLQLKLLFQYLILTFSKVYTFYEYLTFEENQGFEGEFEIHTEDHFTDNFIAQYCELNSSRCHVCKGLTKV